MISLISRMIFFVQNLSMRTPLDSAPSELSLPDLILDYSDRSLLVEEQRKDSRLSTIRELARH